jgi:hypothetical protein
MLAMKIFSLLLIFFSFASSSSELMIVDEGRYLYFIVVGNDGDEIVVDRNAFNLNDGLNISVYTKDNFFRIGASDSGKMKSNDFRLTESVIVGRRIPKMFLSSFYNITKPGEYYIDVKVCLNKKHCVVSSGRRFYFSEKDFSIPSNHEKGRNRTPTQ